MERVLTEHPVVATVTDTVARKMRVHLESTGHNFLALDGVLLGIKLWVRFFYAIITRELCGISMTYIRAMLPIVPERSFINFLGLSKSVDDVAHRSLSSVPSNSLINHLLCEGAFADQVTECIDSN